jgi:DNA-binding transcriptional ArsR family regulator
MSTAPEQDVSQLFFALGDATRLAVVTRLGSGVELSATALSGGAAVTRQAIVKHLRVLDDAGLVTHRRRGREVLYTLEARRLDQARAFLDAVSAGWDRAIDRLRSMVEAGPGTAEEQKPPARKRGRAARHRSGGT